MGPFGDWFSIANAIDRSSPMLNCLLGDKMPSDAGQTLNAQGWLLQGNNYDAFLNIYLQKKMPPLPRGHSQFSKLKSSELRSFK
jgi:hypothetical protein